jgi:hypothetical protein
METVDEYRAAVWRKLQQKGLTDHWGILDWIGKRVVHRKPRSKPTGAKITASRR